MPERGAKLPPLIGVDPMELSAPVGRFDEELGWVRS